MSQKLRNKLTTSTHQGVKNVVTKSENISVIQKNSENILQEKEGTAPAPLSSHAVLYSVRWGVWGDQMTNKPKNQKKDDVERMVSQEEYGSVYGDIMN